MSLVLLLLLKQNMKVQQYRWGKSARDRGDLGEDGPGVLEENILGSDEKKLIADEFLPHPTPNPTPIADADFGADADAGVNGGPTEEDLRRRTALGGLLTGKGE